MSINNFFAQTDPIPARPIAESYWVIPGRLLAGEYPGIQFAVEKTRQRLDAFLDADFDTFIDFTGVNELPGYSKLLMEQASYYGRQVEHLRFPIMDFGLPTPGVMTAILDAIDHSLEQGRRTYVHCHGGIGRTGTSVGCFLVRHGQTGSQALAELAGWWKKVPKSAWHPRSPETPEQAQFVMNWAEKKP
jgi:hypothetical protein